MAPTWLASLPPEWTAGCPERVFDRAVAAYDSPGRRYHTWRHVLACVEELRSLPAANGRAVFLALLFHDAVYVAGRGDNERRSAELAKAVLSEAGACAESDLAAIERMILATRDHHAAGAGLGPDERLMLDIDLSILGSGRETYAWYAGAIREEFVPAAATERQFRIGRFEFLQRLRGMQHIFLTAEGRTRWEAAARENLAWEAEKLDAELGLIDRVALRWRRMRRMRR